MALVVPTEEVIALLPDGHRVPSRVEVRRHAATLERQGQIVPLMVLPMDSWDVPWVYAAVELGWDTMLIETDRTESG